MHRKRLCRYKAAYSNARMFPRQRHIISPPRPGRTHTGPASACGIRLEFQRIKVGVGDKPKGWDLADYVLGRFNEEDREKADKGVERAAKAAECMLQEGIGAAMNLFNGKI